MAEAALSHKHRGAVLQNVSACLLSCFAMPDRNRNRQRGTPEFELAYYTKELGKPLQRQMLQKQLALLSESIQAAGHGEDLAPEHEGPPPQEDRAG